MKKLKSFLVPIMQKLKRGIYIFIYNIFVKCSKINENKILIASNRGKQLNGNIKFIYDELKKKEEENITLLLTDKTNFVYSIKFVWQMANSKITIIDDFFPLVYPLKIRKGAKLVQVWHAVGAFKKVGFSRLGKVGGPNEKSITHKNYTDIIVSSNEIVENYMEAFCATREKVHAIGTPRTDMFFNNNMKEKIVSKLYEEYKILQGKKVILFAPTFRGNGKKSGHYPEKFLDLDKIYSNLQKDEIFVLKMHPFIKNKIIVKEEYKDKIIDLSNYSEVNNLLLITNLLITDYSSIIFEYALLKRPIIFYVPDLDEYKNSRDFYYDFSEYTYGNCCKTQEELLENIKEPKINYEKLNKFTEKFLNMCDGNSTKRFINEIILQKEEKSAAKI